MTPARDDVTTFGANRTFRAHRAQRGQCLCRDISELTTFLQCNATPGLKTLLVLS